MADNLRKAGWSLGWVSDLDVEGRTIWIVDAHREGKRFAITADEKLTAFLEREKQTQRIVLLVAILTLAYFGVEFGAAIAIGSSPDNR